MNSRRAVLITASVAALVVAAGCGDNNDSQGSRTVQTPPADTTSTAVPPLAPGGTGGVFGAPGPTPTAGEHTAYTYDLAAVPAGATVNVESHDENGHTTVTFSARGLAPNRDFGVHVHTRPCGAAPSDSGPHYQNTVDPAATAEHPSTDPAYANPRNEVWLDVTTDANGSAESTSTVDWEFRDGQAKSVVLHAHRTMTAPGQAGMAGDRLACVDEDF